MTVCARIVAMKDEHDVARVRDLLRIYHRMPKDSKFRARIKAELTRLIKD